MDQSKIENRKQEHIARAWAYDHLIGLVGLVNAYKYGCRNKYEVAEFLHVSEAFLQNALTYYSEKYATCCENKDYIVYFNPLGVIEKNRIGRGILCKLILLIEKKTTVFR